MNMHKDFKLGLLPSELKLLVLFFILALLFAYGASLLILTEKTGLTPQGIQESYNGNENNEAADIMKFRKSNAEMLATVHSHVFTLGIIFLLVGGLTYFTSIPRWLRSLLMIEPLGSLIITFSSLILMWQEYGLLKYLTLISGALMHASLIIALAIIFRELYFVRKTE